VLGRAAALVAAVALWADGAMRTRVYVDGYNLYYACLKGSPYNGALVASARLLGRPPNFRRRWDWFATT
jgi:hypothetical protein